MSRDPGFEPARKQVEPQQKGGRKYAGLQKGGRKYAGLRQQILPGGEAILQGAPE